MLAVHGIVTWNCKETYISSKFTSQSTFYVNGDSCNLCLIMGSRWFDKLRAKYKESWK